MRIAQVAPLYESVPPQSYGGTERVVSWLTEELVEQGHDVTLFASGDSETRARLLPVCERSLRSDPQVRDTSALHLLQLEEVFKRAEHFDIIHFHIDYSHFPLSRRQGVMHVTTLHGRLDLPELVPLFREFNDMPVVSISESQREPLRGANWIGTVHHGLPNDLLGFHPEPGGYLAFLGRISPEKGVDKAIEIARRAGLPLRIAAKVDKVDQEYYEQKIEPLLTGSQVEFIGEVGGRAKEELLGGAAALLFPVDWPEPFGLVMIESMACGTPVVAFRRGSVPEVMIEGRSGFVCDSVEEAVAAVEKIHELPREECRRVFEERYTVRRMAEDYLRIYEKILEGGMPDEPGRRNSAEFSHRRHLVAAG